MGASYPFSFRNKSIGEKIFGFNIFRAVWVLISGVETPERGGNPATPALNCRAKHNPALKRRGGNLHLRNLHPRNGDLSPLMFSPALQCRVWEATVGEGF